MYIYSIYDHIPNAYTIIYCLVWSHTSHTYSSLDQIHHTSWDIHVGVATSECRKNFYKRVATSWQILELELSTLFSASLIDSKIIMSTLQQRLRRWHTVSDNNNIPNSYSINLRQKCIFHPLSIAEVWHSSLLFHLVQINPLTS